MKTALLAGLCIAELVAVAPAAGADLVISTGREGGSYHAIGLRLRSELSARHRRSVDVVTSVGSLENLDRLGDPLSKVNLAFTQTDALDRYLEDHPEFAQEMLVLGDVGRECVFIVASRDGPIADASDLKKVAGYEISLDAPASGAAVTFDSMSQLEPAFQNTSPVFVDLAEALLQLKVGGEHSSLKAALFVQRPLRRSRAMQVVLDEPEAYRLVPITERDLPNTRLPDGSEVYEFEEVTVGGKERREPLRVETLCLRGLLLGAKPKLDRELRALLSQVLLASGSRIVGEDE